MTPPRTDHWQRAIDALLGISGRASGPLVAGGERLFLEAVSHPAISRATARLADLRLPKPLLAALIARYVALYDVDMQDAADEIGAHPTFNSFFTRALRPGARPIDPDPDVLVSPADARLTQLGAIGRDGAIPEVKGRHYGVATLLGGTGDPLRFTDGSFAVLYLSPRDYHRVHAPIDAVVTRIDRLDGHHYPVNTLGTRRIPALLAKNLRVVFHLESKRFGPLALVMVGATNVGRITTDLRAGDTIARGDEIGAFNLGSTVVLLSTEALTSAGPMEGEVVRVGRPLLRPQG
ncbi:MAG: phosphatidylserine decarboxylase [Deltaproteobacteria bacterium]|nr:MAG: phosphatidylserine decarboxylase [Deltaproteobacteria bacterium]